MSSVRLVGFILVSFLLVACQNNTVTKPVVKGDAQLRAVLTKENGQWIATKCTDASSERFQLQDDTNFIADAEALLHGAPKGQLFIDAIGFVNSQPAAQENGSFTVKQLNRLTQDANKGCHEDDYNRVIIRAIGKNPLWVTSIAPKGLVLERINQAPLVLPYVDERLPDGQMNFATEGNGQKIQLWAAPERCVDEETGEVYSLRTILTVNYQTLQGCGYLGKASGLIN